MRRSYPQLQAPVQPAVPALDPLRSRLAGPVDMSGKPLMPNTAPVANGLKKLSVGQAIFQRKNGPQASNMIDPRTGQRRSIAEAAALMPQGGYRVAGYDTSNGHYGGSYPRPRIGSAAGAVGSKGTPTSARGKFMRGVREGYDEASVQQGEQAGRDAARAQAGATAPVAAAPVTSATTGTTAGGASTTAVPTSTPWQDRFREYQKKGYSDEYASTYADNDAAKDATAQRAEVAKAAQAKVAAAKGPMLTPSLLPTRARGFDDSLKQRPASTVTDNGVTTTFAEWRRRNVPRA